jgi:hypothetical protein
MTDAAFWNILTIIIVVLVVAFCVDQVRAWRR